MAHAHGLQAVVPFVSLGVLELLASPKRCPTSLHAKGAGKNPPHVATAPDGDLVPLQILFYWKVLFSLPGGMRKKKSSMLHFVINVTTQLVFQKSISQGTLEVSL